MGRLAMDIGLTRLANQRLIDRPFTSTAGWPGSGAMQARIIWKRALVDWAAYDPYTTTANRSVDRAGITDRDHPHLARKRHVALCGRGCALAAQYARQIKQAAGRYRQLELADRDFGQSQAVFARVLQGGSELTRDELLHALEEAGIATTGQRGYHMLGRAAQDGLICFGARSGKQQTFVLLDEWVPPTPPRDRDEALAELARRYFTSHGPATVHDLARWAGLTVTDARRGLAAIQGELQGETVDGQEYWLPPTLPAATSQAAPLYLLPGFDEFVLGYGDRGAILDPAYADRICPGGNGVFSPTVVIDGQIRGTWKRHLKRNTVTVEWTPFQSFSTEIGKALFTASQRYGNFLGLAAEE
ncbi:MAG: winged helix DNA-binding domain-containing protein [Caldilineaceae bacterium]